MATISAFTGFINDVWPSTWSAATHCPLTFRYGGTSIVGLDDVLADPVTLTCYPPIQAFTTTSTEIYSLAFFAPTPLKCPQGWDLQEGTTIVGGSSILFKCCPGGYTIHSKTGYDHDDYCASDITSPTTALAYDLNAVGWTEHFFEKPTLTSSFSQATALAWAINAIWVPTETSATSAASTVQSATSSPTTSSNGASETGNGTVLHYGNETFVGSPNGHTIPKSVTVGVAVIGSLVGFAVIIIFACIWRPRRRRGRPTHAPNIVADPELESKPGEISSADAKYPSAIEDMIMKGEHAPAATESIPTFDAVPPVLPVLELPDPSRGHWGQYETTVAEPTYETATSPTQEMPAAPAYETATSPTQETAVVLQNQHRETQYIAPVESALVIQSNPSTTAFEVATSESPPSQEATAQRTSGIHQTEASSEMAQEDIANLPPAVEPNGPRSGIVALELEWLDQEEARLRERRARLLAGTSGVAHAE